MADIRNNTIAVAALGITIISACAFLSWKSYSFGYDTANSEWQQK
jgi:hypothetical protein